MKKGTNLIFSKLCENGQGNLFKLRALNSMTNANYLTFWNDFSHYSIYGEGPYVDIPLNYSDNTAGDQSIFSDRSKFIDYGKDVYFS